MTQRSTRIFAVLITALALAFTSACGSSEPKSSSSGDLKDFKVLVSAANSFEFLPAELGVKLGVWKKRGLNIENIYVSGGQWPTTLASGTGDVGLAGGQVGNIVKGLKAKTIAPVGFDFKMMVLVTGKKSGVKSVEDLKGKVIGITSPGSVTDNLARRLIDMQGWKSSDLKIAAVGGYAEQMAALESGATNAFIWTAEAGFQLEETGDGSILMNFGDAVPNGVFEAMFAPDKAIADRPDDIQAYVDGWFEVIKYMKENKDETVKFMAEKFKLTESVVASTYDYDIDNLSTDGVFSPERLKGMAQYDVDSGRLDKIPPTEDFYDPQFTPKGAK